MHMLRFDMRVPDKSANEIAEMYECAIEMAKYIDDKGPGMVGLSEHHASDDGYAPTPLLLGSSMAAVTENVAFMIAATLLPLYEPVRLAEEMIILDHLSRGRTSYVLGIGYRPAEYELFNLDFKARGKIADQKLAQLREAIAKAVSGEAMPRITPKPHSPEGPMLMWGGGSKAAAKRAGRNGLGFVAQVGAPGLEETYQQACKDAGFEPGLCMIPPKEMPNIVFVHPDPDAAWQELGPWLLNDARSYALWNREAGMDAAVLSQAETIEDMRAENGPYRVVTVEQAVELAKTWGRVPLHPLCGGLPPQLAWPYLKRVVEEVTPAVNS